MKTKGLGCAGGVASRLEKGNVYRFGEEKTVNERKDFEVIGAVG
jgi:hypothetical protein